MRSNDIKAMEVLNDAEQCIRWIYHISIWYTAQNADLSWMILSKGDRYYLRRRFSISIYHRSVLAFIQKLAADLK